MDQLLEDLPEQRAPETTARGAPRLVRAERRQVELRPMSLDAEIIPPRGAIHGFLFFDVSHDMSLAEKATLYVPNVTVVATKKVLIFYEVAVGRAPTS